MIQQNHALLLFFEIGQESNYNYLENVSIKCNLGITEHLLLAHPHLPRPNGSNGDDPLFSVGYMPARGDFHVVRFFVF